MDHLSQFTPRTLRLAFSAAGLEIVKEHTDTYPLVSRHAVTLLGRKTGSGRARAPVHPMGAEEFEKLFRESKERLSRPVPTKPVVFIHGKKSHWINAKVGEYSLKRNSRYPDLFDVRLLFVEDFPALCQKYKGRRYRRENIMVPWNLNDPQSFVPLRFLPPKLMNYQGRALVMDSDIFAVGDVFELLGRDMQGKAILCRQVAPSLNSRKNHNPYFVSSVMLLDCARLKHWRWEDQLKKMFAPAGNYYNRWIGLKHEPEETIGILEDEWNHYDTLNEKTKLLHNTRRVTQPWMTGLPYFSYEKEILRLISPAWIKGLFSLMRGKGYLPYGRYLKHPDENQERFFFSLLKECLETGFISEEELRREIRKKNIRPDAFEVMNLLPRNVEVEKERWWTELENLLQSRYGLSPDPLQSDPRIVPPVSVIRHVQKKDKSDPAVFFESAYRQICWYLNELEDHGYRPGPAHRILDFGVGTGQLLPHYLPFGAKLFGCDITPEALRWTQSVFGPRADLRLTSPEPPLPYENNSFDYIYANSVFTHIPFRLQESWMKELRRVLKASGILVATAHDPGKFDPSRSGDGWYEKNPENGVHMNIYFTEAKLRELWSSFFKIAEMRSYAPKQTHLILRPKDP